MDVRLGPSHYEQNIENGLSEQGSKESKVTENV
jgi:hypothetical protein